MVTLITEQLRKQSLEEPYHKAFCLNVNATMPAVGSSPTVSWSDYRSTQELSFAANPSFKDKSLDVSCGLESVWSPYQVEEPVYKPEASNTDKPFQSSPPPPPPKRHCRSLSVPEDLSCCSSAWHPKASKIWMPVKRGETSRSGSGASSLPLCGPSSSFNSSPLHSSSSPTFCSLALSADSPLPWSFPWDACDTLKASFTGPSSCSSSPAPLASHSSLHRQFSHSPLQVPDTPLSFHPAHAYALSYGCSGMEHPTLSPSPISACSTPSSFRRNLPPALPRCHSQPCDMRKPRLKRRRDSDVLPGPRPGLDFSKMTQIGNGAPAACGAQGCIIPLSSQAELHTPAEFSEQANIEPLSESEEDEDKDDEAKKNGTVTDGRTIFEIDCTELDLNLIEEN